MKKGLIGLFLGLALFAIAAQYGNIDCLGILKVNTIQKLDTGVGVYVESVYHSAGVIGAPGDKPDIHVNNITVYGTATGISATAVNPNILINGNFDVWQRTTDSTAVSTTRTYVPDRFAVTTGAGTLAHVIQSTTTPTNNLSRYSLELQGAEGVTTVDIDQRIEAANIHMVKGTVSFSAYVYNGSGAAFTPTLFMGTPSAADNFTTVTVRNNGGSGDALQECADTAWTQVTWTADISAYTDLAYGLEVRLRIPSGSLVASDTVRISQVKLERSSSVTAFQPQNISFEMARCEYYFRILGKSANPNAIYVRGYVSSGVYFGTPLTFPKMRSVPVGVVVGTWHVANSPQPQILGKSDTSVSLQALASGTGHGGFSTYDATTYVTLSSEL